MSKFSEEEDMDTSASSNGEEEEIEVMDLDGINKPEQAMTNKEEPNTGANENTLPEDDEMLLSLRRSIRRLLNCVSEAQMSKTVADLVNLFSDKPRATVRKILIEEIDVLLGVRLIFNVIK